MRLVLLIAYILLVKNSFGQVDSTNIYYQAIKHYNSYLQEIQSDDREIFIEKNHEFTQNLPAKIGNRKIVLLTVSNSKEHYKKNQNRIKYIKIYAGKIYDDKIDITLMPHYGEYNGQKKGFSVSVSDHLTIHFQFDCNQKRFIYLSTSGTMPLDMYKK